MKRKVDKKVITYEKENPELFQYIKGLVEEKYKAGIWDKGIEEDSQDLVSMLFYEYATSIEKLTKGGIFSKEVIDKLSSKIGRLRFGDFKKDLDNNVMYDGINVTSNSYKNLFRRENGFGAHSPTYIDENGETKTAIALFDNEQKIIVDDKEKRLTGINLRSLADIRQTFFHELTHIMERCTEKTDQLTKEDIILIENKSIYINEALNEQELIKKHRQYINDDIDKLLIPDSEKTFQGISTIEIVPRPDGFKKIIHNQISEGATEYIANKVLETIGEKVKDPSRYKEQKEIIGEIFEKKGLSESITTYLTKPYKIINELESIKLENTNLLHYLSNHIIENDNKRKSIKKYSLKGFLNKFKEKFFKPKSILPEGILDKNSNLNNDLNISKNKFKKSLEVLEDNNNFKNYKSKGENNLNKNSTTREER